METIPANRVRASLTRFEVVNPRLRRFVRFGLTGLSGLLVNTAALFIAVDVLGIYYLAGVFVATQASTLWNFVLSDSWVFDGGERRWGARARYSQFWLLNNGFLVVRGPIVWLLTDGVGFNYLVSNLLSLVSILGIRYAVADRFIWRPAGMVASAPFSVLDPSVEQPVESRAYPLLPPSGRFSPRMRSIAMWLTVVAVVAIPAIVLRVAYLDSLGFNSDEAVYAGQAASITGDPVLTEYFPIFRAHPLLFQTALSLVYQFGVSPLAGRLLAAAFGLATVWMCYLLGKELYGRRAGVISALILAVMPYHVIVTRQVLLDGPMVFFATTALYLLARFAGSGRVLLLYASAAALGLTALTNERSVVMLGGVYLFFALVPSVTVKFRHLIVSMMIFSTVVIPYPLSVFFSGKSTTGEQFLAWQLFRRANHGPFFYPLYVPPALGWAAIIAAGAGLVLLRRRTSWREVLLGSWCVVPLLFFEIWPVKGFQYLLALAPPIAVLAGRALAAIPDHVGASRRFERTGAFRVLSVVVVASLLASTSWSKITPSGAGDGFLAGSGGVPGGREAGEWVGENLPEGAQLLAIGPSMANIIQWYGDRKTYGLSVSPNPLHRNPVYEPIVNPDLLLRDGDLHYLVWDSFSASRSEFFSAKLLTFAERYHGRIVHQEFIEVTTAGGRTVLQPVITIYEVRP